MTRPFFFVYLGLNYKFAFPKLNSTHMKTIFFSSAVSVLFLLITSFSPTSKVDDFSAKLVGIEYYSRCNCSTKSPIFVRIIYKTNENNYRSMRMVHKFKGSGMTITVPVSEKDKNGNIVYNYCSQEGKSTEFETTFISEQGVRSNPVQVVVDINKSEIIAGTAPKTITLN